MQVFPDYKNGVYNVPHTILNMMGLRTPLALEGFGDVQVNSLVFILVDALGYNLFKKHSDGATMKKITSVFPSTTAAALTTIYTGLSPREHAVLEWYMYYEEYGGIIKTLPFSPMHSDENDALLHLGVSPEPIFHLPTIFQKMSSKGITCSAYMRKEYAHASYSSHMLRGAEIKDYENLTDAFRKIKRDKSDFIYLYIDYLDTVQHAYGPNSKETDEMLKRIFSEVEKLKKERRRTIIVSADHGQIEIRKKRIIPLKSALPGGGPRDMFIYGEEQIPEDLRVLDRRNFLNLLGPGKESNRLKLRIPYMVILPEEHEGIWYENFYARGLHGGLSAEEMYVPFILYEP